LPVFGPCGTASWNPPYCGIVWGLTPYGARLGHTDRATGQITLHPALLDPRQAVVWKHILAELLGVAYARDVLLHELVHVALKEGDRAGWAYRDAAHNTDEWCAEITRITPLLGLPEIQAEPVKPRRVDGKVRRVARDGHLERAQIAAWPHPLRPPEYYVAENTKIPVPI
jgi:hypothetical protein